MYPKAKFIFCLIVVLLLISSVVPADGYEDPAQLQANADFISGRVVDNSGYAVEGVTIRAVLESFRVYIPNVGSGSTGSQPVSNPPNSDQNFYAVQTDADGNYILDALPPGRYSLSADKVGLDFAPLSYTVNSLSGGANYDFQVDTIPTVYSPNTKNLSEATISQLISITSDGTIYTFGTETPELALVSVDDIIVGGVSTLAPDGFLRKVNSKSYNGAQLILVTEQATLVDAFESLSVNVSQPLTSAFIQGITNIPGVKRLSEPAVIGISDYQFALNNTVLFDQDQDLSTTGDQVIANGLLSVSPTIEFRIKIENSTLRELFFNSTMRVQTGFTVSSNISVNIPFNEQSIFSQPIPLGAIPVGPLVLTPEIDLIAGISGSVFADVSASITNTTTFTAGLWHLNDHTLNLFKFESNFSFSPLPFQQAVAFKASVGPKITARIFGIAGPYLKSGFAMNPAITPASNPWLKLRAGLEVSVGVSRTIPIIAEDLINIQSGAINHWLLLYSLSRSANNQPDPPANPTPSQNATDQSLVTQLNWAGGDPDGDAVVYDIYFAAGNPNPNTKVADHQSENTFNVGPLVDGATYYWKVVAFDQSGLSTPGPLWNFTAGILPGDMVTIPPGNFKMGCDPVHNGGYGCALDEQPLHTVYLDAYQIDKYEVTNAQYAQCVAAGNCTLPWDTSSSTRASYFGNPTYANYPVISVDWYQSSAYCTWASKRLPTEAEWEKAARGTTPRAYPWGDQAPTCSLVNGQANGYCVGDTSAVGSYPAGISPYGAMDMAGNVWEWVSDWYNYAYYDWQSSRTNPTGPIGGRFKVGRGGGWWDTAPLTRVVPRFSDPPTSRMEILGFRCAASVGIALPGSFTKSTPTNNSSNPLTTITLDWNDSAGATDYSYCYDTSNDGTCSTWISTVMTSQATLTALIPNTIYYWHVRAKNRAGFVYSNADKTDYWSFTIGNGGDIFGEMVTISAGNFSMGCDPAHNGGEGCLSKELPLHLVYLDAYRIDKYEVTNAQYSQCVEAGICTAPFDNSSNTRHAYYNNPIYASYPVIDINWQDAVTFCIWVGKRLPTEAEWEKAARGTNLRAYPWGDKAPTCSLANGYISEYCVQDTNAVGSYPAGASAYGVMDMAGNVWEWVSDWYSNTYYGSQPSWTNPTGPATGSGKVVRGGNWADSDSGLRVAERNDFYPGSGGEGGGIRCAAPPP